MTSSFGRGLRRFVDSLQRGLFDEVAETPAQAVADPRCTVPADPLPAHPQAGRTLTLAGQRVAFRLARVRRKSIGFVVDGHGLTVRAPKWVALREIDAAVREKQAWILARLAEQSEREAQRAASRVVWRDGATIDYLGQPLVIELAAGGEQGVGVTALLAAPIGSAGAVRAADGAVPAADGGVPPGAAAAAPRLLVALPGDAGEERIRDAVQSWLQREARRVFAERAAHFAALLGVRVKRLSLSSAATRWGSASANGSVRLHWRLIQHPPATIDYVVAHELAHLREMNHGERFWQLVRSVVRDVDTAKASLRDAALSERP